MNQLGFPILSLITFTPLLGIVVILAIDGKKELLIKKVAFAFSLIVFAASLTLYIYFDPSSGSMQFVENRAWIEALGAKYFVGIDGISLFLVLLTTFLTAIGVWASWLDIARRVKEFMIAMLFLETGMIGVFISLDLFLFYVFWEMMLIPMYLLIGIWGGSNRVYAAIKFFLFTMAGSVLMLVGILSLYFMSGKNSFDLFELYKLEITPAAQQWLFLAFFFAFAIKVPMFPFHTWLPDAHVEAPTAGSVLLAGILLKMGAYGFIRFSLPLFPAAAASGVTLISILALVGIVYGALVSMVQPDLKKLVAYSSVSHLGFVMLGIFALNPQGLQGGILQMINHGLSTGALFLVVGMVYERTHTRMIADYGGLWRVLPVYGSFFLLMTLSSIGLPGLNGFVGEFLILVGAFRAKAVFGVIAATGVILAAVYMLWMFQRVMFGKTNEALLGKFKDLSLREVAILAAVSIFVVYIGVHPGPFLSRMEPSVREMLLLYRSKLGPSVMTQAGPSLSIRTVGRQGAGLPEEHRPVDPAALSFQSKMAGDKEHI